MRSRLLLSWFALALPLLDACGSSRRLTRRPPPPGGLELRVLERLQSQGVVAPGALRVVQTREVMGYPWVGRTALGQAPLEQVRRAFLELRDPALLDLLRARSYVEVRPADDDEVRTEAARLGLLR